MDERDNISMLCYSKRKQQSLALASFSLCVPDIALRQMIKPILGHINKPTVAVSVKIGTAKRS